MLEHLVELRQRLIWSLLAIMAVFLALLPFSSTLFSRMAEPLAAMLPEGSRFVAIDVAAPFVIPLKLTLFLAVFATAPFWLYQAWRFVAPALYRHEQRLALPLLFSSTFLFYVGCAFAYLLVLPMVFNFMAAVTPEGVQMMTDIGRLLDFVLLTFLAFGLCFEIPIAVVLLVLTGWATPAQLRSARGYVLIGVFTIAAVVTPPDVLSQLMLAVPMYLLYELGIVAGVALKRAPATDSANSPV